MERTERHIPQLTARTELLDRPEGLEAVVAGQRRLRLSPEAAWLVSQLDGRLTVEGIAERLGARLGRAVTPAQARDLLERTLVSQGIATFGAAAARHRIRRHRVHTVHPGAFVAATARRLAILAHPAVMLALAAGAAVVLGQVVTQAQPDDWHAPLGWALAPPLAALSLWAHEWMHAIAFARAGGVPGAITLTPGGGLRLSTELPKVRSLPRGKRLAVDLAGVYAHWVLAGAAAALAFIGGGPLPLPALAAMVLLAVLNLVPYPGSDGARLLQDLFQDAGDDRIARMPRLGRLVQLQMERFKLEMVARMGGGASPMVSRVLPTMLAMSFPSASPAWLRTVARKSAVARVWFVRDTKAIAAGERVEQIRHASVIRGLRAQGRGALVCSMHLGPFPYVPVALAELGCSVMAYASEDVRAGVESSWIEAARHQGASFEALTARSSRDALRAVRGLREGRFLALYMDGQFAASRDQHRSDFRFLGQDLYMRTGPALLAASAKVPIVLAACYWDGIGRRMVEFSDPIPPPESRDDNAIIARTAELYRWFEPIVAARPGQWPGWAWPIQHWRRTGNSPTATREAFEHAIREAGSALRGESGNVRLVADDTLAQWLEMNGERLLIDGPGRRVLAASPLACDVLEAAHRRTRLRELPQRLSQTPEILAVEVARLTLSGLARLGR
ncbi:MAG: hypothetical protein ABIU54_05980 [Candidatus Eisenbacteria bacterium]